MIRYVYLTVNQINNKKYIGQRTFNGDDVSKDSYLGSGVLLKQAIEKYGKENFSKEILCFCLTDEELNFKEKEYILQYNAVEDREFYNIAEGGNGGNTFNGLPKEEKERIRNLKSQQTKGDRNPNYGHKYSQEERQKMSEAVKMAYLNDPDHWGTTGLLGEKNSLSKTIYSPELNQTFVGIREASRKTGIPSPNIIRALKSEGKFSAGKLNSKKIHWFYVNQEENNGI